MNTNLTELIVVVDRSGSMESTRAEAEGGLNKFIEDQKKGPGQCNLTLIEFDTDYNQVYSGPINGMGKYTLVPRGWTALNDAVGRAVNDAGVRLANTPEEQRPGLVILSIITDGGENRSKEFAGWQGTNKVREMLEHQQTKYSWQVQYLGSNQDAFKVGSSLGIRTCSTYTPQNTRNAFNSLSGNSSRMRSQASKGLSIENRYTSDEIASHG